MPIVVAAAAATAAADVAASWEPRQWPALLFQPTSGGAPQVVVAAAGAGTATTRAPRARVASGWAAVRA